MHAQPDLGKILQTGLAFFASKTLLSAVEMGVFRELAQGPQAFAAVAGRLPLHPRSARDFLGFDVPMVTPIFEAYASQKRSSHAAS